MDRRILENLLSFIDNKKLLGLHGSIISEIGKFFLGAPYRVGTLERKGSESLVINLREFDCFTFVENVVALSHYIKSKRRSFEAFKNILKKIRYRKGVLNGYTSRLHYFSDWIYDNQRKGFLRDITEVIGGAPFKKNINFMTRHPELYPSLKISENLQRMKTIERRISRRLLFFISKNRVNHLEDQIGDSDIIAITTDKEGLDVEHIGISVRIEGRIHLLHASRSNQRVIISEKTLHHYLFQSKSYTGIMISRVNDCTLY